RPSAPRSSGSSRKQSRVSRSRAAPWSCPWSAATFPSTMRPAARRSCRLRSSGWWVCSTMRLGARRRGLRGPAIAGAFWDRAPWRATQWLKGPGHRVALLGPEAVSLGGSEYLWTRHRRLAGALAPLDFDTERRVQRAVRAGVAAGLVAAAHDCSEGGVAVALAESCVTGRDLVGCEAILPAAARA